MASTDDRLRAALRDAALEPALDGVTDVVRAKRARRRAIRQAELAFGSVALVVVLVVGGLVLFADRAEQRVTASPAPAAAPIARVADGAPGADTGRRAAVRPVHVVPDEGYVRGPLLVADGHVALAAYDRSGDSFSYPPSRIVRVGADGKVVDRVNLQGEILALADGEGARWALTRDKVVNGTNDPQFRVKRIGPDGSVLSNPVPPGTPVIGTISAGGGGVWVPTRDGVLRFDSVNGAYAGYIGLSVTADRRAVAPIGKGVYVTDGTRVSRLDPATDRAFPGTPPRGNEVAELTDLASTGSAAWELGRDASGTHWFVTYDETIAFGGTGSAASYQLRLPAGFAASGLLAMGDTTWIEGTLRGAHTLLLVHVDPGRPPEHRLVIARTIRLDRTTDSDLAALSPDAALLTSGGSVFRIRLPG